MSQVDNRYGVERGLHKDGSNFRDEDRGLRVPNPSAPEPGAESVGPLMFDLVQRTHRSIEVQNELIKAAIPLLNTRNKVEYVTGTTDGAGLLDLVLYRIPQGFQFIVNRVEIEDATHTPGAPYSNATGWIALIRGEKYQPGSLLDFAPNPPLANSPILPCQFSDGASESAILRGGEIISLHIFNGPATTDIWVRLQGIEQPA